MTEIEKMRQWLGQFDGIPDDFQVDYTQEIPNIAGLFPQGVQEIRRKTDIEGNVTVTNQLNFGLYSSFSKPKAADGIATQNAEWVMKLQNWGQEQSATGKSPVFGNINTNTESIKIQNGTMYALPDKGVALYMVLVSVQYQKYFGG